MTIYNGSKTFANAWSESISPQPWTAIWQSNQLSNGKDSGGEHWSNRRWVSTISGPVVIQGEVVRLDYRGDAIAEVFINGVLKQSYKTTTLSQGQAHDYLLFATLSKGDVVDFALSPNGSAGYDETLFTSTVSPPSSLQPPVGASTVNLTGSVNVTCANTTTGQSVAFKKKAGLLDCKAAGLVVNDNDMVSITETGKAIPFAHHRYEVLPDCGSWLACESAAAALGGHLATVETAAEQAFISSQLLAQFKGLDTVWLGLSDSSTEGTFVWVTGKPLTYTNWAAGQPDNHGGIQDCVGMLPAKGRQWDDLSCDTSYPALVEYE